MQKTGTTREKPRENGKNGALADYLKRYRGLTQRFERRCVELARFRERSAWMARAFADDGGRLEEEYRAAGEEMRRMEQELCDEITRFGAERDEMRAFIERAANDTYKALLEYRYLDGMTWSQIAAAMHYSYQWVHHLHALALESLGGLGE